MNVSPEPTHLLTPSGLLELPPPWRLEPLCSVIIPFGSLARGEPLLRLERPFIHERDPGPRELCGGLHKHRVLVLLLALTPHLHNVTRAQQKGAPVGHVLCPPARHDWKKNGGGAEDWQGMHANNGTRDRMVCTHGK